MLRHSPDEGFELQEEEVRALQSAEAQEETQGLIREYLNAHYQSIKVDLSDPKYRVEASLRPAEAEAKVLYLLIYKWMFHRLHGIQPGQALSSFICCLNGYWVQYLISQLNYPTVTVLVLGAVVRKAHESGCGEEQYRVQNAGH